MQCIQGYCSTIFCQNQEGPENGPFKSTSMYCVLYICVCVLYKFHANASAVIDLQLSNSSTQMMSVDIASVPETGDGRWGSPEMKP